MIDFDGEAGFDNTRAPSFCNMHLHSWPLLLQLLVLLLLATHVSSSATTRRSQRGDRKARQSSSSRPNFWLTPERRQQPDTIKAPVTPSSTSSTTTKRMFMMYKDVLATVLPFECSGDRELVEAIQPSYQRPSRLQYLRSGEAAAAVGTTRCRASKSWAGAAWYRPAL